VIAKEGSITAHGIYLTWTPCISFSGLRHTNTTTYPGIGSVLQFALKMKNCSQNVEKIDLVGQSVNLKTINHFCDAEVFDLQPGEEKSLDLLIMIPPVRPSELLLL
jgi:hypothetical protein